MISEWRRLLNRKVLFAFLLLVLVNILLFLYVSLDGDIVSTRNETVQRITLLNDYRDGILTFQDVENRLEETTAILRLFDFRYFKQEYPDEYALHDLEREIAFREEYPDLASDFDKGVYEETEIRERQSLLLTVYDSITYSDSYRDRLNEIQANAEKLSSIGIFQTGDGSADRNIRKTARDYARLSDIPIIPGNDASTGKLITYNLMPFFGILFSVVFISQLFEEQKYGLRLLIFSCKNGRGSLTLWRAIGLLLGSVLFALLLYGSTMLADLYLFGTFDPQRTVQSVPELFGITVPMSLGQFWGLYLACGIVVQLMVSALMWCIFSVIEHRAIAIAFLAGILGGSVLLYQAIPDQSVAAFLKYTNLAAMLDYGAIICTYQNVYLGSLLVEKNWLSICGMLLVLLTAVSYAVWCGIHRYSISGHGRLYRAFQSWLENLSRLYHRAVSHLPFMGIEAYKVLAVQRGLLVLLALLLILSQVYQTKTPIYVGTAEFMQDFYSNYAGETVTEEVREYVGDLQTNLAQVEAEWIQAVENHQNGQISPEEYELQFRKYEAYDVQRQGLEAIQSAITYIQQQEQLGYSAVLVDPTSYNHLLNDDSLMDRAVDWISIFAVAVLCAGIFSVEKKSGLLRVLYSTRNGRARLALRKALLGVVFSFAVYVLFTAAKVYSVISGYGIASLDAPVHSLTMFSDCPLNWSIGSALVLYALSKWLVYAVIGMIACMISVRLSYELSICGAAAVAILPEVLAMMGLDLFENWNIRYLEERAAAGFANGNWGTLILLLLAIPLLMLCACLMWKNGRGRKT